MPVFFGIDESETMKFLVSNPNGKQSLVASVVFDEANISVEDATKWITEHGYKSDKVTTSSDGDICFSQVDVEITDGLRTYNAGKRTDAELMADKITFATEDLFELEGIEIFRVGTWNGDTYTAKDLDAMVDAFDKIGFRPPLKLGHNEESDAPAFGWVRSIRRAGEKLVADFMDLPKTIYDAIKQHRFDTVSIEAYWNLTRNKQKFPLVLKAVALLGSTIPAVSGLKPLRDSFSNLMADVHVYQLTNEDLAMGKKTDDNHEAEVKKLADHIADLTKQLAAAAGDDTELKKLQAELKTRDDRIAAIETSRKSERKTALLKTLRVPAYREFVAPLLDLAMESTKVVKFGEKGKEVDTSMESVVNKLIGKLNADTEHLFTEITRDSGFHRDDGPRDENAGAEVDKRAKKYMSENKEKDYMVAVRAVCDADADLKKAYQAGESDDG